MSDGDYEINGPNPLLDLINAKQPWEWTKKYPGLAKTLADTINYGGMAIRSSSGAAMGRDAMMVRALEQKALHAKGPYDWGITGGEPNPVKTYLARGEGRDPLAIWERSSNDLGSRPGVQTSESLTDRYDPVFRGAKSGKLYYGPDRPANSNAGDNPYRENGPSYDRSLQGQRDERFTNTRPNADDFLAQMAKEIKAQTEAEFGMKPNTNGELTKPDAYRLGRMLTEGESTPRVDLNLPDKALGPLGLDRGITGGTDPNSVYTVPGSAEALLQAYRDQIKGARSSNVVPFGTRKPANDPAPRPEADPRITIDSSGAHLYDSGPVSATLQPHGDKGGATILEMSANPMGKGHGTRALQELKDLYGALDVSDPGSATQFWDRMRSRGLVRNFYDENGALISPEPPIKPKD